MKINNHKILLMLSYLSIACYLQEIHANYTIQACLKSMPSSRSRTPSSNSINNLAQAAVNYMEWADHCYMRLYDVVNDRKINDVGYFVTSTVNGHPKEEEHGFGTLRECKTISMYDDLNHAYNEWMTKVISTYENARGKYHLVTHNCCTVARNACLSLGNELPFSSINVNFGIGINETANSIALSLLSSAE